VGLGRQATVLGKVVVVQVFLVQVPMVQQMVAGAVVVPMGQSRMEELMAVAVVADTQPAQPAQVVPAS